ncbi:NADH-ubiquinone reductase complex 1 MLRQ subunit-domain-containing protein [Mrakia frigida]|uniref:NADH-ubiquinone reductase complex 1 MLRQ subunit-domain-containing protein n=1 Tax=Mrakia frigida TaxID=29902 RepID=UPI003FCC091A
MFPSAVRAIRPSARLLLKGDGGKPSPSSGKKGNYFMTKFFAIEVLPIWAVAGGAVAGATWYLTRLARGPDVVWDRQGNPRPWEHVKPNQQVKLFAVNHVHDGEPYRREKL